MRSFFNHAHRSIAVSAEETQFTSHVVLPHKIMKKAKNAYRPVGAGVHCAGGQRLNSDPGPTTAYQLTLLQPTSRILLLTAQGGLA